MYASIKSQLVASERKFAISGLIWFYFWEQTIIENN